MDANINRELKHRANRETLLPPPTPRILAAIHEGFASGIEGEMNEAFWQECDAKLESYIAAKDGPAA